MWRHLHVNVGCSNSTTRIQNLLNKASPQERQWRTTKHAAATPLKTALKYTPASSMMRNRRYCIRNTMWLQLQRSSNIVRETREIVSKLVRLQRQCRSAPTQLIYFSKLRCRSCLCCLCCSSCR